MGRIKMQKRTKVIIIIVLILVVILIVVGKNNKPSKNSKEVSKEDTEQLQKDLVELTQEAEEEVKENIESTTPKEPQINNYVGKKVDKDTVFYDENNNQIQIPAGFIILDREKNNNVQYYYSSTGKPTVQDGIVITDEVDKEGKSIGNEFVWIPVGTIKNQSGEKIQINFARYKFDVAYNQNTKAIEGSGKAILAQQASEYDKDINNEENSICKIYSENNEKNYFYETTENKSNRGAKDLERFLYEATEKGGFYIARYEAGKEQSQKTTSKPGKVWSGMSQTQAATAAETMYENKNFTSDLINSYAWDTAIKFIQIFGDENYPKTCSKNKGNKILETGERDQTTDKECNIYDIASNCFEWTTETCSDESEPCVYRGGSCKNSNIDTASKRGNLSTKADAYSTFRTILYI